MVFIKYTVPPINTLTDNDFIGNNVDKNYEIQKWIKNTNSYEEMLNTLLKLPHYK
jgi:biotin synthase-like enzyme